LQIYPSPDRKRQRLYHGTRVAGAAALSLGALLFMPLCDQETPPSAREKGHYQGQDADHRQ
jgi:hypothetical protein